MRTIHRVVFLAAAVSLGATSARAEKTEALSSPVATTGAVIAVAGGVGLLVGTVGYVGDLGARISKAWNEAWCWSNCRKTYFDNTPRDAFGATVLVGLGTALVGIVIYVTASSRVRVTPAANGVLVEGTF